MNSLIILLLAVTTQQQLLRLTNSSWVTAAFSYSHSSTLSKSNRKRVLSNSFLQMSKEESERKRIEIKTEFPLLWEWVTHSSESYHDFSMDEATAIRSSLLMWYRSNRRKLPWRGDPGPFDGSTAGINKNSIYDGKKRKSKKKEESSTKTSNVKVDSISTAAIPATPITAYGVWVSEIMLQQTRVEAVIPYYIKWMKSFPTIYDVVNASEDSLNAHWAGLGFYRRVRMLHKGAKLVVNSLDGNIPETVDELMKIDGIGRYTASAIASIAFDKCVPVVDGNVCRVLSRLKGVANNIKSPVFKDKIGWNLAQQIVMAGDGKHAGEVNQALMELGATYCSPSGTGLDERDPLVDFYVSTKIGKEICTLLSHPTMDIKDVVSIVEKKNINKKEEEEKDCCRLCDPDGISNFLIQVLEELESNNINDGNNISQKAAMVIAHRNLPLPPIKKRKREEVLVVTVLSCNTKSDEEQRWLMVKRPVKGLLAGQWEFPCSCVWVSTDNNNKLKRKIKTEDADVPFIEVAEREMAVDKLLKELRSINGEPVTRFEGKWFEQCITHVFSHVRHTMYIKSGELSLSSQYSSDDSINDELSFVTDDKREFRWMRKSDMKSVGITSGVKKILAADTDAKEKCKKKMDFFQSRKKEKKAKRVKTVCYE